MTTDQIMADFRFKMVASLAQDGVIPILDPEVIKLVQEFDHMVVCVKATITASNMPG